VVTSRSTLNARNLSTGEIRWSAIYGKSIVNNSRGGAHPIVFDGVVYDVSDGYVVAARLNDGEKLWQREIKETVYSPLTCTDRTLYIVTDSGQVLGFNLEDGRLVVDTSIYLSGTRGRAVHAPCAGAGRVYVPFGNKLAAIDRDQGGKVWDTRVTSSVVISPQNPSYLSNIVVTTTNLGDVHGYNASTGLEEWETRIFDGKAIMFRTSTYDEIVIGGGNPIQNQNKARVVGLDVRTGNEEWSYSLGQGTEIHGTPFIADELVWFITDNQNLIALQAENGRLVVKEKIQEIETLSNTNPVGVGERIIYYGYILSKYDKNR
jgi:outer membrane protein assembly factor BamB